jgi:hypothetical protein
MEIVKAVFKNVITKYRHEYTNIGRFIVLDSYLKYITT